MTKKQLIVKLLKEDKINIEEMLILLEETIVKKTIYVHVHPSTYFPPSPSDAYYSTGIDPYID